MMYDEGANLIGAIHNAHKTGIKEERERIIRILTIELDKDKLDEIVWLINDINIL